MAAKMFFEKRRRDWRLGRWTGKLDVFRHLGAKADRARFSQLEILAAADGAPEVFQEAKPFPIALSISHSADISFCAVAAAGAALGCDLEEIRPREENFASDYFTPDEIDAVDRASAADRSLLVTLILSAKESALKALRQGLRRDTRSVRVDLPAARGDGWTSLTIHDLESSRVFTGWWQLHGSLVRTIATDCTSAPPAEHICS